MERINTNYGVEDPATVSSLNSSGSSLTEHIFANALSNLEDSSCSDDDVQFKDEDIYQNENTSRISAGNNSFLGFNLKEIMKEHSFSNMN